MNFLDPWGLKSGDVFPTVDEAANDFGLEYNAQSIINNIEYGTTIIQSGDGYTYIETTTGTQDQVTLPIPQGGSSDAVAGAHTHGAYKVGYDNNNFSQTDINTSEEYEKPFYVATPDGTLKVYEPEKKDERIVNTNMPSDANDPERKNNVDPDPKKGK